MKTEVTAAHLRDHQQLQNLMRQLFKVIFMDGGNVTFSLWPSLTHRTAALPSLCTKYISQTCKQSISEYSITPWKKGHNGSCSVSPSRHTRGEQGTDITATREQNAASKLHIDSPPSFSHKFIWKTNDRYTVQFLKVPDKVVSLSFLTVFSEEINEVSRRLDCNIFLSY